MLLPNPPPPGAVLVPRPPGAEPAPKPPAPVLLVPKPPDVPVLGAPKPPVEALLDPKPPALVPNPVEGAADVLAPNWNGALDPVGVDGPLTGPGDPAEKLKSNEEGGAAGLAG